MSSLDLTVTSNVHGDTSNYAVVAGKSALLVGELDMDGMISPADYSIFENASNASEFGYRPEDFNLDGTVDLSDFSLWENNNNAFRESSFPLR